MPSKPAANPPVRKSGADLRTQSRWRVVTAYFQVSKGKDRLPRSGMQELRRRFPSYNLTPRLVQRIFKNNRNQDEETSAEEVDLSRKCHEKCGGTNLKLSVEISRKLIELNDKSWSRLSCKKVAGKLREEGFSCSKDSVKRWCQVLGAVRRKRYITPLQSKRQRCHRLRWVISKYDKRLRKFENSNDVAHGDEKWFYLLQDGSVCRVFPIFQVNDEGELQSKIKMPASAKVYHKSRQPRVMFLAVTAKPRPEYQFDGKVGNWPFTLTRKAQRSVKKNWHCSWSNLHTGKCVRDGGGVPSSHAACWRRV